MVFHSWQGLFKNILTWNEVWTIVEFHEDFSYSTIECFTLHEEIEALITNEYLTEFAAEIRKAQKSIEKDKCKNIANASLEHETP